MIAGAPLIQKLILVPFVTAPETFVTISGSRTTTNLQHCQFAHEGASLADSMIVRILSSSTGFSRYFLTLLLFFIRSIRYDSSLPMSSSPLSLLKETLHLMKPEY